MLVYQSTKEGFFANIMDGDIEEVIHENMKKKLNKSVGKNEVRSWQQSLQYMHTVMSDSDIPGDCGVSIEARIPNTNKRIDFIISGADQDNNRHVIIVELKAWEKAYQTGKDGVVKTVFSGNYVETSHPSYQAWSYSALLQDFNETIYKEDIRLKPCTYLHNYNEDDVIRSPFYQRHWELAPAFLKKDARKLQDFIKEHVKYGDNGRILYRIDNGNIRPSKHLINSLNSMMKGNREFIMVDEQKVAFENALYYSDKATEKDKHVLIVEGGPGTGKSVVAINLLVEIINREKVAQYVTKNAAPRSVYESKLTNMTKSRFSNLFKGSGSFTNTAANTFDALIVDEAHRLNERSGLFGNMGENQVKELINASKFTLFFIDEDQRVTFKDIGSKKEIKKWAKEKGCHIHHLDLPSQFRCNGSDGYIAWLDHLLDIRETANTDINELDYDFQVMDNPKELEEKINELNKNHQARLLAGYCWNWVSKNDTSKVDIEFPEHRFHKQWNLTEDGSNWIIKESSINEVGCIHTCQGLELDYAGVIIGPDLIVRNGQVLADPSARAKTDKSLSGYKKMLRENPSKAKALAGQIIKNTYKTLLSRGIKGCYIYCTDEETNDYFKWLVER